MASISISIQIKPQTNTETQFNRKTGVAYTPAAKKKYQREIVKRIKKSFKGKPVTKLKSKYLMIQYTFIIERPKRHKVLEQEMVLADNNADLDNYEKPVQDCLGKKRIYKIDEDRSVSGVGLILDDRYIKLKFSQCLYTRRGQKPGIAITITEITTLTPSPESLCFHISKHREFLTTLK